jgi:hypothetical protein
MTASYRPDSPSDLQAGALLQAWVCGDVYSMDVTLDHIANSRIRPFNRSERTRLDLLKVVARGLRSCPNRYASRSTNPALGLYVELLSFLSNGTSCNLNGDFSLCRE